MFFVCKSRECYESVLSAYLFNSALNPFALTSQNAKRLTNKTSTAFVFLQVIFRVYVNDC